ncbi:MAG: hypothetical protein KAH26_04970, partial [Bacteroidales bacterium]|nr:hypothetical protein [Bacteroidales bacterium]
PQSRNNKLIITGKLFEYLASGTPVLSVGPVDGDAAGILADTAREKIFDYKDKQAFKQKLMQLYLSWKSNGRKLDKLDTGMLDKYSRRSSARKISEIMNKITL